MMKVTILKTGETKTVADSYGTRLLEQGQAVATPEAQGKEKSKGGTAG